MERNGRVEEYKYLWTVLLKHGKINGEVSERIVKGKHNRSTCKGYEGEECACGSRGLRNSILMPVLIYGTKTRMQNNLQQSRVCAIEISYLRGGMWSVKM